MARGTTVSIATQFRRFAGRVSPSTKRAMSPGRVFGRRGQASRLPGMGRPGMGVPGRGVPRR